MLTSSPLHNDMCHVFQVNPGKPVNDLYPADFRLGHRLEGEDVRSIPVGPVIGEPPVFPPEWLKPSKLEPFCLVPCRPGLVQCVARHPASLYGPRCPLCHGSLDGDPDVQQGPF